MKKHSWMNEDTGLLGLIAIACMICDHIGAAFFRQAVWLRVIGRVAFPLYAWGVAVGAEHTRDWRRYALRLVILGVISQPFYMFGMNHRFNQLNVLATLLCGLLAIEGVKEKKYWLTAAALLFPCFVTTDYGVRGVLLVLLLWGVRGNTPALCLCYAAFCIFWGGKTSVLWTRGAVTLRLQTCAVLALPLMLWPRRARLKVPRAVAYGAYPAHLAVIWLMKQFL